MGDLFFFELYDQGNLISVGHLSPQIRIWGKDDQPQNNYKQEPKMKIKNG